VGFALANNHILDVGNFKQTIQFLKEANIPYCGLGNDIEYASKPMVLYEGNSQIVMLNFGWEVIQCEVSGAKSPGVNPLIKEHVIRTVQKAIANFPEAKVIPYMHWSYELEAEPQPFERELAKHLIDIGVAGIIGSHPHRIGGFELYKGKPIVYSLGNWMFKQNYYNNGEIHFPDFCNEELAFEWDFSTLEFKFHFFEYNPKNSILSYLRTERKDSRSMEKHTPFRGLSNKDYIKWYKLNHYHKGKGLPVYYWNDREINVTIKNRLNKFRDYFIYVYKRLRS
jgi:hypothetical protein